MKNILYHLVLILFAVGSLALQFSNMDRIERYGMDDEEYLVDNEMQMITPEKMKTSHKKMGRRELHKFMCLGCQKWDNKNN